MATRINEFITEIYKPKPPGGFYWVEDPMASGLALIKRGLDDTI
jgi:hypothetical protein